MCIVAVSVVSYNLYILISCKTGIIPPWMLPAFFIQLAVQSTAAAVDRLKCTLVA